MVLIIYKAAYICMHADVMHGLLYFLK